VCDRVEYVKGEGIFVYYKGCLYPQKGFPFPRAAWSMNIVKMSFMTLLKSLPLGMLFKSSRNNIISSFCRHSDWVFEGVMLDDDYWQRCARGVKQFCDSFFTSLGFDLRLGLAARAIVEYDDAYKYRLQDLMNETEKSDMLKDPRKELKKIIELIMERDKEVPDKLIRFVKMFRWILLVPKIKRAFRDAVEATDWSLLQMDEADRYYCLNRMGYNFFGREYLGDRAVEYNKIHNGVMPTIVKIS
jgi:hypothetical protein